MRPNVTLHKTSLSIILISCFLCLISPSISSSIPLVQETIPGSQQESRPVKPNDPAASQNPQEHVHSFPKQVRNDIIVLSCPVQNEDDSNLAQSLDACIKGVEKELNRKKGSIAFVDLEIMGDSSLKNFDQAVLQSLSGKKTIRLWSQETAVDSFELQTTGYTTPNVIFRSDSEELLSSSRIVLSDKEALNLEQLSQEKIFELPTGQQEIQRVELPKIQCAGGSPSVSIIIGSIIVAGIFFGGVFIVRLIKKKKSATGIKEQHIEKKRFINSKKPSLDTSFKDFSINPEETNRNSAPVVNDPKKKPLSPQNRMNDGKMVQALKLEDNGDVSAEPENIFTNIDNSPKSLEGGESPVSSVRDTPKHLDFKIEFSMIEGDSKIKSSRTGRANVLEQDPEE